MNKRIFNRRPHIIVRLLIIIFLIWFVFIENNPLVRLEAILGISPSPIERFFGIKSLFSGMTEGVHQFVHLNFLASVRANVFAPFIIPIAVFFIITWKVPKVDTKKKEYIFFLIFIVMSLIVNIINR